MNDADKPKIEELAQEVALWNSYREARRIEGIDITEFYADLASAQKQALTSPGAREDFTELCNNGCFQITLAALVVLLRYSPQLENCWTELVGRPDNREKSARNLEQAVETLENLFGNVIASEKQRKYGELVKIGRLPVSRVISELRLHIRFINFAGTLQEDNEIRSPVELTKYLLTSYGRRMTGRLHHRNVSSLIQEVLGLANYDDVAHRMWCNRNYKRTKRICELIIGSRPPNGMRCASVRFGNVLGSSGSVIPVLTQQLQNNEPLTVTHPDIKRFFMTTREAVALVLQAFVIGQHGDILVLDMGESIRIVELARTLIRLSGRSEREIEIRFTGLREGEKLNEELFYEQEKVIPSSCEKIKRTSGPLKDWPTLCRQLEELRASMSIDGAAPVRAKVKEIVPEYSFPIDHPRQPVAIPRTAARLGAVAGHD
jgi:hypothetical protein